MVELTSQEQAARERVCLPLDGLHSLAEVQALVQAHGAGVFLDLKYHDIPNTEKGAARAATEILNRECGVPGALEDQVLRLARSTEAAGLDGIVCSAADMYALKGRLKPSFLFVTPGIKGTSTPAGEDQKRVLSPGRARRWKFCKT